MKYCSLFLISILLIACKTKNPVKADQKIQQPEITFSKDTLDFGTIKKGDIVSMGFHFTNSGKVKLKILNVVAGCSCSVATYPRNEFAPGKGDSVVVKYFSENAVPKKFVSTSFVVQINSKPSIRILTIQGTVN